MARPAPSAWIVVIAGAAFTTALAAQTVVSSGQTSAPVAGTPRDVPPPPPSVRRIPIGTSTISGSVTAADTGKPIRGARISLTGSFMGTGQNPTPGGPVGGVVGGINIVNVGPGGVITSGGAMTSSSVPLTGRGMGGMGLSRSVVTDAAGQFSFQRLPAGQFTLMVVQQQFLQTVYGQRRPGGQGSTIRLIEGQQLNLKVQMIRGGVITGTVYGEDGEPQRGVQVRGLRYTMINGVRRLQQSGFANTDDRGVYRLFGLQPGDYMVSATPSSSDSMMTDRMEAEAAAIEQAIQSGAVQPPAAPGLPPTVSIPISAPQPMAAPPSPPPAYLPVYAPSSLIPSGATKVTVAGGDERGGVDIQVRLAQASQVQGTVATAVSPGVSVQVSLVNDDPTMEGVAFNNTARVDQNGRFTFRAVAPGKYTVFAQTVPAPPAFTVVNGQPVPPQAPTAPARLTDDQKLWGRASVTVEGQSMVEVNLPLRPARSISGIVLFEMAKPPDLSRMRPPVFLTPAPSARTLPMMSSPPSAQIEADGRFTLTGVMPGLYVLRPGVGTLKSAMVGGQDTADFPLDFTGERDVMDAVITVTDRVSDLSGVLTDASGKPVSDYTVLAASADSRFWIPGSRRIVMSRPSSDGRYAFRGLPPGDYMLAVLSDLEQGTQYDPEFLRSLGPSAIRVVVPEGGAVTQDLRVR